ncbi:bifunctional hydroxymethylpyrimidine kinase/phosphomethylpyrimidine kinase [Aureimonas frigidaquae]|uniref:hydroxymethylpyrimidine kinase n=1 Tax=Aureimonas frigidaquae TaxID=424757 RepID=A0A0P0Z0V5_9HYPH|nr:bifunctional hydroxymethylpyrimidine kinase/phosphomethylpyrimidine kinase [Aureimonas frigidaquae]BAT27575.1 phosphomethylpyrimidine kinase [Aureimonas frigidaquae]
MTFTALTIAGSDSGGGAGIQADLKTFSALGVYGASALTAVTAQNTCGVTAVETLSPSIVAAQIDAVLSDIAIDAIKIGMVSSAPVIDAVADRLLAHRRRVVLDPVMIATSGDRLLEDGAVASLMRRLLPLAQIVTPNLPEAALLSGRPIAGDDASLAAQAQVMLDAGAGAVLIKDGHGRGPTCRDVLFRRGAAPQVFSAPRLVTRQDHGTGCTLSAAIAAGLARGLALEDAVAGAKAYLHAALAAAEGMGIGKGRGPVHHFWRVWQDAPTDHITA